MSVKAANGVMKRSDVSVFKRIRSQNHDTRVCIFWLQGKCNPDRCRFLHTESSSLLPQQSLSRTSQDRHSTRPISTWKNPNYEGPNNRTSLTKEKVSQPVVCSETQKKVSITRGTGFVSKDNLKPQMKQCKYWVNKSCVHGDKCKDLHAWSFGNGFSMLAKFDGHSRVLNLLLNKRKGALSFVYPSSFHTAICPVQSPVNTSPPSAARTEWASPFVNILPLSQNLSRFEEKIKIKMRRKMKFQHKGSVRIGYLQWEIIEVDNIVIARAYQNRFAFSIMYSTKASFCRRSERASSRGEICPRKKTGRLGEKRMRMRMLRCRVSRKAVLMAKMISWRKVQHDDDDDDDKEVDDGAIWKRTIVKGGKCRPLQFSGKISYDSNGNLL